MMRFVYGGTILVMLAMAIFGAFGAAHGMEHGGGCFLAIAAGMTCVGDIAASLNMHFNALRAFSLAVFAASLAAAFLIAFTRLLRASVPPNSPRVVVTPFTLPTTNYNLLILLPWLSRLEHSPSFLFG